MKAEFFRQLHVQCRSDEQGQSAAASVDQQGLPLQAVCDMLKQLASVPGSGWAVTLNDIDALMAQLTANLLIGMPALAPVRPVQGNDGGVLQQGQESHDGVAQRMIVSWEAFFDWVMMLYAID